MHPVHTVERDGTPGHMSSAFLLCKPHLLSRTTVLETVTMDNRRDGGAGKAVVTVKAMGNIPVGRLESQGTVLTRREGQTSALGLLGINPNYADTILLPSVKSGLFTPCF